MQRQMLLCYVGLWRSRIEARCSVYWIMCHEPKYFTDGDRYIFRFTKDILFLFYMAFTFHEIHRFRIRS